MRPGLTSPQLRELLQFRVNIPDAVEVLYEPLYNYLDYPAAGQREFIFFKQQIGVDGATLASTNMDAAGQMPKGRRFLVTGMEVDLLLDPTDFDDNVVPAYIVDYYAIMTARAYLQFTIGSKPYMRQAPLIKFPPSQKIGGYISANVAAGTFGAGYAVGDGKPMDIVDVVLESNQNFDVGIVFDDLVPITATPARLGMTLRGYLFRNAQ